MSRLSARWTLVLCSGMFLLWSGLGYTAQYTAFSLKVARDHIEQSGESWRQRESDVLQLAGINRIEGFVYDETTEDLILIGEHDERRALLELDDLVVALRARFRHKEWPAVSIDPMPEPNSGEMLVVRFEGGIQNSAFGKSLFDADYLLKQISMGLKEPGIPGLRNVWDREIEEIENRISTESRNVMSRFWFYPINPHVVIREGVCVVRGLKVGVFTEVLKAEINGKPVADVKNFKDSVNDVFANDVSLRFDDLCSVHPSFNRLRGLQELVAVTKALEESYEQPDLTWWLYNYPLQRTETPDKIKLLRRKYDDPSSRSIIYAVEGGVAMMALAMRLNAGDVGALRNAVLKMRSSNDALHWSFIVANQWLVDIEPGKLKPEDVFPLLHQVAFLAEQERYQDALAISDKVIEFAPNFAIAHLTRGKLHAKKGDYNLAITDFTRAIQLDPDSVDAYHSRGLAYTETNVDLAIADFTRAIQVSPGYIDSYIARGTMEYIKANYETAIADCNSAIGIQPEYPGAYIIRGLIYSKISKQDLAIRDLNYAVNLDPNLYLAYHYRGDIYTEMGNYSKALADYTRSIEIDPSSSAYNARGELFLQMKDFVSALNDFHRSMNLNSNIQEELEAALIAHKKGDRKFVEDRLDMIWKRDKGSFIAYLNLMSTYEKLFAKASLFRTEIAELAIGISLAPNSMRNSGADQIPYRLSFLEFCKSIKSKRIAVGFPIFELFGRPGYKEPQFTVFPVTLYFFPYIGSSGSWNTNMLGELISSCPTISYIFFSGGWGGAFSEDPSYEGYDREGVRFRAGIGLEREVPAVSTIGLETGYWRIPGEKIWYVSMNVRFIGFTVLKDECRYEF